MHVILEISAGREDMDITKVQETGKTRKKIRRRIWPDSITLDVIHSLMKRTCVLKCMFENDPTRKITSCDNTATTSEIKGRPTCQMTAMMGGLYLVPASAW